MPHDLTGAHAALISSGHYDEQIVLDITLNDGVSHLYLSTGDVQIYGVVYRNTLLPNITLKQSLTRSMDRVSIEIANVNMLLGRAVSGVEEFNNLHGVLGIVHINPVTRIAYYNEEMEGDIMSPEVDETGETPIVRIALVDDFDTSVIYGQTVAEAFPYSDPPPAIAQPDPNDLGVSRNGNDGGYDTPDPIGRRPPGGRYEPIESLLSY